jgi:opacity protein-like surface antigen
MMKRAGAAIVFILASTVALCAQSMPDVALTDQVGLLKPVEVYDAAPVFAGAFDVYLSEHVSLRTGALWSVTHANERSLRRVGLIWDIIYAWKVKALRPFVGAGVGMHLFQTRVEGRAVGIEDDLNFGSAATAGLEVFLGHATAITGEVSYFKIEQGHLTEPPSMLTFRLGLKQYF